MKEEGRRKLSKKLGIYETFWEETMKWMRKNLQKTWKKPRKDWTRIYEEEKIGNGVGIKLGKELGRTRNGREWDGILGRKRKWNKKEWEHSQVHP